MFQEEKKLDYSDLLIVPKEGSVKSRKEVSLLSEYTFPHSSLSWRGTPIAAANMDGVGTFSMAKALYEYKMITFVTKFKRKSEWRTFLFDNPEGIKNYVGVSSGISSEDIENSTDIFKTFKLKLFCIDVANGYSEQFLDAISKVRSILGDEAIIFAGNVVTAEMTKKVIDAGADVVKVGIGPGSVCTTRIKTGVGYPQFSAVKECSDAADEVGGHIMADGGCTCPGDVAKSFVAGSSFSMLGGIFAGHDESELSYIKKMFKSDEMICTYDENRNIVGYKEKIVEKKFFQFYGMSSKKAQEKNGSGLASYRASEGREVLVESKGSVHGTVLDLLGGIRSACTYVGARNLAELFLNSEYVLVNRQYNNKYEK